MLMNTAMANNHFKAMLPSDALVVAVHPAGAGRWPNSGLTAGGIAGIVCGILGASALRYAADSAGTPSHDACSLASLELNLASGVISHIGSTYL